MMLTFGRDQSAAAEYLPLTTRLVPTLIEDAMLALSSASADSRKLPAGPPRRTPNEMRNS
jgi:hypothetical protein